MTFSSLNLEWNRVRLLIVTSLFIAISVGLASCSHPRESFLENALGKSTQEVIRAELGDPVRSKTSLLYGKTIWIFRYVMTEKELDPTGLTSFHRKVASMTNAATSIIGGPAQQAKGNKPLCVHYILTFDKSDILREWKREDCAQSPL